MKGATQVKEPVLSNRGSHSEEGTRLGKKKNREETVASTSAENVTSDCDKRTSIHLQQN